MGANSGIIKFLPLNLWNSSDGDINASSEADTDHLVENTQTQPRNQVWRSTGLTGQWIERDLGGSHAISAVAVVYPHIWPLVNQQVVSLLDLSIPTVATATVRVRVSTVANFATTVYDSGTVAVWETIYDALELLQGMNDEFFPAGIPTLDTQKYLSGTTKVFLLPAEVTGRYIRIDLNDTGNSLPYIDVSYVYAGKYFEASPDLLYGWKIGKSEAARLPRSAGGTMWQARVYQRTKLSFSLGAQAESSVLSYWALLSVLLGTRSEIIVQVYDKASSWKYLTTIYGRMTTDPKLTNIGFQRYGLPFTIDEIIA